MKSVDGAEPDDDEVRRAFDELYGELKGVRVNTTTPPKRKKMTHDRKGKKGRTSPVTDYVRSLGDYKTTSEVAEEIGQSEAWVRKAASLRWTQAPSKVAPFGNTHVYLYTKEDIAALKKFLKDNRQVYDRDDYFKET